MEFVRPSRIALVDDDDDFRGALAERLSLEGYDVLSLASADAALRAVDADFPGVVVADLRMPGMDGRQLLDRLTEVDDGLPVIMITGHGDIAEAVEAMRRGAYDFVAKPFATDRLIDGVNRALEKRGLVMDNRRLAAATAGDGVDLPLLGSSPAMERLRAAIVQVADTGMDVLIEGETGVGKEVVARALHDGGRRRIHPFVAVNCGALPEGLIDSELFGHEPGAFPGAIKRRVGHIERSHRGTLFLDEIESMPLPVQIKLLRVVEEREVQPIGAGGPRALDLRILASSKIDLAEAARRGAFREDLYYRLNVVKLRVAPLRERREDVPLLFAHFLRRSASRQGLATPALTTEARRRLLEHDWPGNVRELAHFADRVVAGLHDSGDGPAEEARGLADRMERYEAALIREALERAAGDVTVVGEALQLPRKTLYDKLRRHGLRPADFRGRPG